MTVYDWVLVGVLVLLLPAEALWKSLRSPDRPKPPLSTRLMRSIRVIAVLSAVLVALWVVEERLVALLGLDLPVSTPGLFGLAAAAAILGLMGATVLLKKPAAASGKPAATDLLPQTRAEMALFLLFALAAGIGWEVLYRGYLLWALSPFLGTTAAVVVAAIAYGLGHGSRGAGSVVGAVIMSFIFTIAYAVTGSLWWLILLHTGLPIIGILAAWRSQPART